MSNDPSCPLLALHTCYCEFTGRKQTFAIWERCWHEWAKFFTLEDLKAVLSYVHRHNKKESWQYSLKLTHLLEPQHFDDLLGEARAHQRTDAAHAQSSSPSNVVVRQFRQSDDTTLNQKPSEQSAKNMAQIMEAMKKAAQ